MGFCARSQNYTTSGDQHREYTESYTETDQPPGGATTIQLLEIYDYKQEGISLLMERGLVSILT